MQLISIYYILISCGHYLVISYNKVVAVNAVLNKYTKRTQREVSHYIA